MSNQIQPDDGMLSAENEQMQLGQLIREAREYLGLSQEFVAEHLGIPRASISAIETGKRKVSGLEIKQLAMLLKRPVTYFLGEDSLEQELGSDETTKTLFRTARSLSEKDRQEVLRFAQFLQFAGRAPSRAEREGGTERP